MGRVTADIVVGVCCGVFLLLLDSSFFAFSLSVCLSVAGFYVGLMVVRLIAGQG